MVDFKWYFQYSCADGRIQPLKTNGRDADDLIVEQMMLQPNEPALTSQRFPNSRWGAEQFTISSTCYGTPPFVFTEKSQAGGVQTMLTFKLDFNRQMQKYKDSQQKMTMISHLLKDAFSSMFLLSMTSVNFAMREELGDF